MNTIHTTQPEQIQADLKANRGKALDRLTRVKLNALYA